MDLETFSSDLTAHPNGALDPHTGIIRLLTLAVHGPGSGIETFLVDCRACDGWRDLLEPVLSNRETLKVAHNGKFDLKFIMNAGIEVENVFDTMLAAQVLHSGQPAGKGYFTLAAVSKRYLGISLDKTEQTSDWGAHELSQQQLEYAARDAAVLVRLHAKLAADLETSSLYGTMQLEMEATPFLAWMELCGVALDTQRWKKLALQAATEKANLEPEILELMTESLGEGSTPRRKISPASPKQVLTVLSGLGVDVDDTKHETLIGVQDRHPFIANLLAYRDASKRHSTYGIKFLEHVLPTTGRIHANFQQIGAATGRMSCGGPNLQNIPKASGYRECFRSSEGKVMVIADLSLIELCVATQLSGDEKMRKAVERGDDLHLLTAAALFQREPGEITVEERAFGKSVNFGTLYGQGRNGLIQQASKQGLIITNLEAGRFLKRFAETWPQLYAWSRQQMASSGTDIRTLSGRRRLLGPLDGGTKRVNTPVQGVAADGFKKAMALLWKQRKQFPTAVPVLAVHDELVLECDETDARAVGEWVTGALQVGMGEYVTKVPIRVDVKIAQTWAG
nr:DNA polymerase [uncultured Halomonas sp.]